MKKKLKKRGRPAGRETEALIAEEFHRLTAQGVPANEAVNRLAEKGPDGAARSPDTILGHIKLARKGCTLFEVYEVSKRLKHCPGTGWPKFAADFQEWVAEQQAIPIEQRALAAWQEAKRDEKNEKRRERYADNRLKSREKD